MRERAPGDASPVEASVLDWVVSAAAAPSSGRAKSSAWLGKAKVRVAPHVKRAPASRSKRTVATYHGCSCGRTAPPANLFELRDSALSWAHEVAMRERISLAFVVGLFLGCGSYDSGP